MAVLSVVLLLIDLVAYATLRVLQAAALGGREPTVVEVTVASLAGSDRSLAGAETGRLAMGQRTAPNAMLDALVLLVLAMVYGLRAGDDGQERGGGEKGLEDVHRSFLNEEMNVRNESEFS